ncbi:hypothetical protein [Robertmurraya andreesenii]|uniref:Uncharacterized protein n=1 Tax=Anoxybacillus andreesenii TaxID=1325932 RepID=A0ABT9V349_9BACL|nr:hypothetical protein [Robertmurraya andreesenii]MDQ0155367.1 hypothetical protein [Robertmurraya andreesenii]
MQEKRYPRVLVISHNAFSSTLNNGKTFSSIFSSWPKEKIAQLYFQNEIPNFSVCHNFFKITDVSILRSKKENIGERVKGNNIKIHSHEQSRTILFIKQNKWSAFNFLRDVLWSSNKWNNQKLQDWLDEYAPEVIFFVGGESTFSYKIANQIASKFSIPIYLYYTDDYLTPAYSLDLFQWINWIRLKRVLKKTLRNVNKVFVIGDDMGKEYANKLRKPCITIMNAIDIERFLSARVPTSAEENNHSNIKMAYFGGMHLNRWKSLKAIGSACAYISEAEGINISLSIYSNQLPDKKIFTSLNNGTSLKYMGSVTENEIIDEMQKYDVLVHVESFDRKMKQKTRLSISTKIPEYLASGKTILAMGPSDISSIKYLKKLDLPYVITSQKKENITDILLKMSSELDNSRFKKLGIEIVREKHSIEQNKRKIQKYLSEVL